MAPFFYLPHTIFVAERGLEHFDLSMKAQYELTKRFSAESSIRSFIAKEPERTLAVLRKWATDANPHVRRLASEGTRLRLPWAARVAWLDENPGQVLEIIEFLKDDASTLVRRSVANNLNEMTSYMSFPLYETLQTQDRWLLVFMPAACALANARVLRPGRCL
jgi:3-methyladenine DNA glycosylase AlkC